MQDPTPEEIRQRCEEIQRERRERERLLGWLTAVWLACLRHERLDEQGRQRRQDAKAKSDLTDDDE
jgi:hypothetical protein